MTECMVKGGGMEGSEERDDFQCFVFFCVFLNTLSCMVP